MSELREAINEMRNMRESYNEIAGVVGGITGIEPDITAGKAAIAEAITDKGVQTSATDTLATMADNVSAIVQSPITIDGGEMYAKQLFGSLTIPNYWNLYEVMAQLLSDGRLLNYGGILLAEYYKGYDSLALEGAGAGGAYVVSDKDSNGQFIMYTADTTHTWNTEDDGKGNRWVAYCFADEAHGFRITSTNTCPRSIHIGRHVGIIESLVAGRLSEIVVTDGNVLDCFIGNGYTQNWNKQVVLKNLQNQNKQILPNTDNIESIYVQTENLSVSGNTGMFGNTNSPASKLSSVIIEAKNIISNVNIFQHNSGILPALGAVYIKGVESCGNNFISLSALSYDFNTFPILKCINFIDIEELYFYMIPSGDGRYPNLTTINIEYKTNNKEKAVKIEKIGEYSYNVNDIALQQGWCKPLDIHTMGLLTKTNIQEHIFDRLGVNDISTGSVTITLAASVLALFTQEEIDSVVERTNITIVGA